MEEVTRHSRNAEIMGNKESLASKRARERAYFDHGPEWYCEFKTQKITGIGQEENINRRDPSAVIEVEGVYYTYYTKNVGPHVGFGSGDLDAKVWPWDQSDIWYASSTDGFNWEEQGMAVGRGEAGSYDDRSVFTPEIMAHEGKYYLVYQAVQHPYLRRTKNTVGMSVADSPRGPWQRLPEPILRASDDGEWEGEEDNRFLIKKKGSFDSHKVHDPVLFFFKEKFFLYYKGEPMGEEMFMGGRETKWGVAIAESVTGPYVKSEYNPVSNSGHETILWPYKGGMVGLLTTDGPERNTVQYAEDGINFDIKAMIKTAPHACGPFRSGDESTPLSGMAWGLTHVLFEGWQHIARFDMNLDMKKNYTGRKTYE